LANTSTGELYFIKISTPRERIEENTLNIPRRPVYGIVLPQYPLVHLLIVDSTNPEPRELRDDGIGKANYSQLYESPIITKCFKCFSGLK